MSLIIVTAPHFCAAYDTELKRNPVAPIIRYMRGWSEARIRAYCARKGWRVAVWP